MFCSTLIDCHGARSGSGRE